MATGGESIQVTIHRSHLRPAVIFDALSAFTSIHNTCREALTAHLCVPTGQLLERHRSKMQQKSSVRYTPPANNKHTAVTPANPSCLLGRGDQTIAPASLPIRSGVRAETTPNGPQ